MANYSYAEKIDFHNLRQNQQRNWSMGISFPIASTIPYFALLVSMLSMLSIGHINTAS